MSGSIPQLAGQYSPYQQAHMNERQSNLAADPLWYKDAIIYGCASARFTIARATASAICRD